MTDFDADKAVPPLRRPGQEGRSLADRLLVTAGIGLAATAAFFPWYVFLNPQEFSVPRFGRTTGATCRRRLPARW